MCESGDSTIGLLLNIGLTEAKAKETAKNAHLSRNLVSVIKHATSFSVSSGNSRDLCGTTGTLLYHIASKTKPQIFSHAPLLTEYVVQGKINSEVRLNAAIEYLLQHPSQEVDVAAFEENCGVGVIVTPEVIEREVEAAVKKVRQELLEKRYRYPIGSLMADVRKNLKWADGKSIRSEIDVQVLDLLGPKTERDLAPQPKSDKKKEKQKAIGEDNMRSDEARMEKEKNEADDGATTIAELMKTKVHFHLPGENYKTDGYVIVDETMQRLAEHLKRTGGHVRTRFPPEPNGILHIGHAKAININFGYAAAHNGICFLRYDDTNPEKEEEKFFTGIKDMVEWLGYKPYKITYSSDYFPQLYEWAQLLIRKDLAYVCHQQVEDIRGFNPPPSPWRNRPTWESLRLFEDMKSGKFDEGAATLRLKMTLEEGKQDPVAYRVRYSPHHRTGDEWCVYPTYDFTHCLCDSLEDITHSLCTKEFQARRSSYYWLCNAVGIYCPVQWEYGRLNVNYTVVSKRKIAKLISSGSCRDWDDPRLFTLTALRRRGFPPEAINNFCAKMGLTGAQITIDPSMLEAFVRTHLNIHATRTMVVLEPLKVNVRNFDSVSSKSRLRVPDFPDAPDRGHHEVAFGPIIYIEKSDFKDVASEKGYRRLTREQSVGLKHSGYVIKFLRVVSADGNEIDVECVPVENVAPADKPKAFVHWVSDPVEVEIRLYDRLFKHKNPEDPAIVPGGFLNDVNTDSLKVVKSLADKSLIDDSGHHLKVHDNFQFERLGFFAVDPDSVLEGHNRKMVFNRTVSLKEDSSK